MSPPEDEPKPAAAAVPKAGGGPPELVRFQNVTKSFRDGASAKVALQDVSFVVHDLPKRGEMVTLVGPSGCGKSTVLRIIAGLSPHFPPTSGVASVFGRPIEGPGVDRGLVDQKYSLLPHLTVLDNIAFGLMLRKEPRHDRREKAMEWVKKVGLEGAESKYPHQLSGGMQQRVAIAATLILKPRMLLMDEPFGALDPKIRLRMQELLVALWVESEATVFFVTHSVEEAIYLGDRIYRMGSAPGRLIEILGQFERPTDPPEIFRRRPSFASMTRDLLGRLENDLPAMGPLAGSTP